MKKIKDLWNFYLEGFFKTAGVVALIGLGIISVFAIIMLIGAAIHQNHLYKDTFISIVAFCIGRLSVDSLKNITQGN